MKILLPILLALSFLKCTTRSQASQTPDKFYDCQNLGMANGIWTKEGKPYTGKCATYFQNGNLESFAEFKNGRMDGTNKLFYSSGEIKTISEFKSGETGQVVHYFENTNKQAEGYVKKGQKEGKWTNYYENGSIESIGNYVHDVEQDSFWGYFPDGKLQMGGFFIDGKMEGKWTFYDTLTGNVDGYLIFKNDQMQEKIEIEE